MGLIATKWNVLCYAKKRILPKKKSSDLSKLGLKKSANVSLYCDIKINWIIFRLTLFDLIFNWPYF